MKLRIFWQRSRRVGGAHEAGGEGGTIVGVVVEEGVGAEIVGVGGGEVVDAVSAEKILKYAEVCG